MLGSVVIIGRANVGKSTLFNRLSESKKAMVSRIPGTTRDLKYAEVRWQGKVFELVDTGGFLAEEKKEIKSLSKKQEKKIKMAAKDNVDKQVELRARAALEKSDLVLMVVDAIEGLNPQDKKIADFVRKSGKQKILVVNKCENNERRAQAGEFYKLGLGEPALLSAASGGGTGDLVDLIIKKFKGIKKTKEKKAKRPRIKVAIVGKPNVGKSSLLNTLAKEEFAIVSPTPHTTREPNDILIDYQENDILIIDTAGIRRKAKIEKDSLEYLGVRMSASALYRADVVLMVVDISQEIAHQDQQLAKMVAEKGSGVIIIINKYDLARGGEKDKTAEDYLNYIKHYFPHLAFAPRILVSAKTGWNTEKILKLVLEVAAAQKTKVSDNALSKFLKQIIKKQPPVRKRINVRGRVAVRRAFITKLQQIDTAPPVFSCEIDTDDELPESYKQYIINSLREKFGFLGSPIKLVIRHKKS
ncbi:ribosome biogenesis GTPase Der [Candidatus Kuenenbacteria bacterium]|nr:ribosome biogenesis GTPase Der [Candidatus Kuenenbacteria bacterium]